MNIKLTKDELITFLNFVTAMSNEKSQLSNIISPEFEMNEFELIQPTLEIIENILNTAQNNGIEII